MENSLCAFSFLHAHSQQSFQMWDFSTHFPWLFFYKSTLHGGAILEDQNTWHRDRKQCARESGGGNMVLTRVCGPDPGAIPSWPLQFNPPLWKRTSSLRNGTETVPECETQSKNILQGRCFIPVVKSNQMFLSYVLRCIWTHWWHLSNKHHNVHSRAGPAFSLTIGVSSSSMTLLTSVVWGLSKVWGLMQLHSLHWPRTGSDCALYILTFKKHLSKMMLWLHATTKH